MAVFSYGSIVADEPDTRTATFQPFPAAMLVGLEDALVARCTAALKPLRIETVPDHRAACDRILLSRPFVIVVRRSPDEELMARARDISAQIVELAKIGAQRLELNLKAALRAAQVIRLRTAHDVARDDAPDEALVEDDILLEDE